MASVDPNNFNDQSTAALKSRFSPDAQKIILSGLGVSPSKLKETKNYGSNYRQIAIATSIRGILTNSVAWTDSSNPEDTRASVTLTEPLKYENEDIALQQGSSIIVEVSDFNQAGFVDLRAIAIVTRNSKGEFIQQEIPEDSLLIRGENNQPLKFETKNSGKGNSGINQLLGSAVKSGARNLPIPRQVGSALSRTINGSGSTRANDGQFYFVEAQTPVSVYVNNSINVD